MRLSLLLVGTFLFSSCDNEEEIPASKENLLKITTTIDASVTRSVVTRTEFQKGDKIGIYVGDVSTFATYTGSEWQLNETISLNEIEKTVYAYYPYTEQASADMSVPVDLMPTASVGQLDYMHGQSDNKVSVSHTTADIRFTHALSRITLAVTKGRNDVGNGKISKVCLRNMTSLGIISSAAIMKVGTIFIAAGSRPTGISSTGWLLTRNEEAGASIELDVNQTITADRMTPIEILAIPTSFADHTVELVLTIDGNPYSTVLPYSSWTAGQQYTYPITINRQSNPDRPFNGPVGVDMGMLTTNGNPLYWATYNVGADGVESYGKLYCWGDPTGENTPEQYSTEYNGKYDFFPEDISGTKFDIARVKWGSKWRIPTALEWEQLLENSTLEFISLGGIKGTRVISTMNGNSIFLPAAGYYQHNPALYGEGAWEFTSFESLGAYWSSTRSSQHAHVSVIDNNTNDGWFAPLAGWYSVRPVMGD